MILLLDVMDTLVRDPFHEEVPAFFGLDLETLLSLKERGAWERFETGEWDEATFAAHYFRDRRPMESAALHAVMRAAYAFLPGVEELLYELRAAGVVMHALSNYPPWYRSIEERLELSRFVAWSFVSCETGVRKPDPQAFLGAAAHLDVDPSECLFVDDRQKNVAGAQAVGMPAELFQDATALRKALVGRGLLAR